MGLQLFALRRALLVFLWVAAFLSPVSGVTAQEGKLQFIPGKPIGMAPPPGFVLSKRFSGFEIAESGASFLVTEFPPQAYSQIVAGMTEAALARQGIEVRQKRDVKVDGAAGLSLSATQTAGGRTVNKWILLLGGKAATVMVAAQDVSGKVLSEENVRAVFASVRFRAVQSLDEQLAGLPFSVKSLSGFRIVRTFAGNGVSLTKGPKDIVDDASQPVVIIVRPLAAAYPTNVEPSILSEQLIRSIKSIALARIGNTIKAPVAGADGHEVTGMAMDKATGKPLTVTQWLRLDTGKQIRVLALVPAGELDQLMPDLRSLVSGLTIK